MDGQKKTYPTGLMKWYLCGVLLSIAMLVVLTGLLQPKHEERFRVEAEPQATAIPLKAEFDETHVESVIELPLVRWFAIQLGAFESQESAIQMSETYQKRGAAGFVWNDERYRVLAAVYPEKQDAQQVREQLKENHTIDSYLYSIEYPSTKLKVSGMKGQVEILEAAFQHAHDLPLQLQNIAARIDRGELTLDEINNHLLAIETQLSVVSLRLRQRYPGNAPLVVNKLLDCFEAHTSFLSETEQMDSAVVFSAKLKYHTLHILSIIHGIYQVLYNT